MFEAIRGHGRAADDVGAALLSAGVLFVALALGGLVAQASGLQEPLAGHHGADAPHAREVGHGEQDAAQVGREA